MDCSHNMNAPFIQQPASCKCYNHFSPLNAINSEPCNYYPQQTADCHFSNNSSNSNNNMSAMNMATNSNSNNTTFNMHTAGNNSQHAAFSSAPSMSGYNVSYHPQSNTRQHMNSSGSPTTTGSASNYQLQHAHQSNMSLSSSNSSTMMSENTSSLPTSKQMQSTLMASNQVNYLQPVGVKMNTVNLSQHNFHQNHSNNHYADNAYTQQPLLNAGNVNTNNSYPGTFNLSSSSNNSNSNMNTNGNGNSNHNIGSNAPYNNYNNYNSTGFTANASQFDPIPYCTFFEQNMAGNGLALDASRDVNANVHGDLQRPVMQNNESGGTSASDSTVLSVPNTAVQAYSASTMTQQLVSQNRETEHLYTNLNDMSNANTNMMSNYNTYTNYNNYVDGGSQAMNHALDEAMNAYPSMANQAVTANGNTSYAALTVTRPDINRTNNAHQVAMEQANYAIGSFSSAPDLSFDSKQMQTIATPHETQADEVVVDAHHNDDNHNEQGLFPPQTLAFGDEDNKAVMESPSATTTSTTSSKRKKGASENAVSHICQECGKVFKHKCNLKIHAVIHTSQALSCKYCSKKFARISNLNEHTKIHTNFRPFKCQFCDKTFRQKQTLIDHVRTHTGERPFKCDFCNKAFKVKHNLKSHRRLHTGERPFVCPVCPKKFASKSSLNGHIRRKHNQYWVARKM